MSQAEVLNAERHGAGPHVVSIGLLVGIWAALMVLTGLTMVVAQIGFGKWDLWIAMAIAALKATLVVVFFMHLYWDRGINILIFVGSMLFVVLFVGISMMDTLEYKPALEPAAEEAPAR